MKVKTKRKDSIKSLKKKAWTLFSIYIRKRDCLLATGSTEYGECITCGEPLPFNELQAGHFIPGRHNANLFSERGTHAQCRRCNVLEGGRQLAYRRQIIRLYGDGADLELEEEARQIKKFTLQDLEDLIVYYREKIKDLESVLTKGGIMQTRHWRPNDWQNRWDKEREYDGMSSKAEIFETGADAMLETLCKEADGQWVRLEKTYSGANILIYITKKR